VALVLGTTGYASEQAETVKSLAEKVPVVYTSNFSLGVTVFQQILKQISPILQERFDVEMIEKHHKNKLDAPSGTAKMLLAAIGQANVEVHSVRAGTIAGEHTALFAGEDEILEITHRAGSNRIFANGAVLAAKYAVGRAPGLYDMNDVLFEKR
jgi:4-hydroxy-tetrahydrodipicolinate reductase